MIKQLSSKVVYQNKWMKINEDQVEFPNGTTGIYSVVEKPDFSLIIPYDGERFYLVKQYRYSLSRDLWEFPQGTYEPDPTIDPLKLAKQELKEETGFSAGSLTKIGYLYAAQGYCTQGFHVYVATGLTKGEQNLEVGELGMETKAFTEQEIKELFLSEGSDAPTVSAYGLLKASGILD